MCGPSAASAHGTYISRCANEQPRARDEQMYVRGGKRGYREVEGNECRVGLRNFAKGFFYGMSWGGIVCAQWVRGEGSFGGGVCEYW